MELTLNALSATEISNLLRKSFIAVLIMIVIRIIVPSVWAALTVVIYLI